MDTVSPYLTKLEGRYMYLKVGSWNVEGLTELKLEEIIKYIDVNSIDIFCIQETHKSNSDYYVNDKGFLIILSGGAAASREWAGVGFVVYSK